jgi:RNA polymerase sigma factor (sigma-70 family)
MIEVVQHLRRILLREAGGSTDAELLDRFVTSREEAALESLVLRHGPMVWGVCRRILRRHHDAEDAFQATFLLLTRKAASISPRDMLGNWLHGVACRTALNCRALAARSGARESQASVLPEPQVQPDPMSELRAVIDEEVGRLPVNYRAVIVLCGLEDRTRTEAAEQLGIPEGTVASRLARAKTMLAKRLAPLGFAQATGAKKGVSLSAAAAAALLSEPVWSATVPPPLAASTVKAGLAFAAGQSATSCGVSAAVVSLVGEGLATTAAKKLALFAAIVLLTAVLGGGIAYFAAGPDGGAPRVAKNTPVEAKAPADRRDGAVAQDKKPARGIDPVIVAAYEKLGAVYGGWIESRVGYPGGVKVMWGGAAMQRIFGRMPASLACVIRPIHFFVTVCPFAGRSR